MRKYFIFFIGIIVICGILLNTAAFFVKKNTTKQKEQPVITLLKKYLSQVQTASKNNPPITTSVTTTNNITGSSQVTLKVNNILSQQKNGGDITITDTKYGYKISAPPEYKLTHGYNGFAISTNRDTKTTPISNYSKLEFRVEDRTEPSLMHQAQAGIDEEAVWAETENIPMLEDFAAGPSGEITGFAYSCPFLVTQKCIYLNLPKYPQKYLFILKTYTNEEGTHYSEDLDDILSTLEYTN